MIFKKIYMSVRVTLGCFIKYDICSKRDIIRLIPFLSCAS